MTEKLSRLLEEREDDHRRIERNAMAPGRATLTSRHVMRAARDDNGVAANAGSAVEAASGSSGTPLPTTLLSRFESSLGADLSGVRLHTGEASAAANDAVGARAYATGQDIHFGAGQYDPGTESGQFLIAHEVAHTVQQQGATAAPQYKLEVSSPGDAHELEADEAARAMVVGRTATVSRSTGVARTLQRDKSEPSVKVGEVTQANDVGNDTAIKELNAFAARIQATIGTLGTAMTTSKGLLASAGKNYSVVQKVHAKVYARYLEEANAANTETLKLWVEKQEAEELKQKYGELAMIAVGTVIDELAEHAFGPAGKLIGIAMDAATIVVGATEKKETPPKPEAIGGPKNFAQDIDALMQQIENSKAVIDCGILSASLGEGLGNVHGRIEALMTSKAPVPPAQLAKLTQGQAGCAAADAAAAKMTASCRELQRQSWVQGSIANEETLLAQYKKKDAKEQEKADLAAKAVGQMAQLLTSMDPTGTVQVGKDKLDGKLVAGPSGPSTAVSGTFRKVVSSDGATVLLDYQDTAEFQGTPSTDTELGTKTLVGTFVTALANLSPSGTVQDLQGHEHPARLPGPNDVVFCGAHVKVDSVDGKVLVLDPNTSNTDKKGAYAAYGPGGAPDLYFPIAKANPALPPYEFGYRMVPGPGGMIYLHDGYKVVKGKDPGSVEFVEPISTPRDSSEYDEYYAGK